MEAKKISFGFKKTKKADKPITEEKREFIDCVEEKFIKVVGKEAVEENVPLIIPMKPNTLVTTERLQQIAAEVEGAIDKPDPSEEPSLNAFHKKETENETLDQMVERELLAEAKKEVKVEAPVLSVPMGQPSLTGEKESTLDDYESVPVTEFGMAMLRGMGWAPTKEQSKYKQPTLRPKGLGLGADKMVKAKKSKPNKGDEETELNITRNGFVKIINGKHTGLYGKVLSLDEDTGRVTVDLPMKKETVSLGEFMMEPVTKVEFDQQSRILNANKYEEYKRNEQSLQKSKSSEKNNSKSRVESSSNYRSNDDRNKCNTDREDRSRDVDNKNGKREEYYRQSRSNSRDRLHRRQEERRRSSSHDSRNRREERKRSPSYDSRNRQGQKRRSRSTSNPDSQSKQREWKRSPSHEAISSLSDSNRQHRSRRTDEKGRRNHSNEERNKRRDRKKESNDSPVSLSESDTEHKRIDVKESESDSSDSRSHKKSKKSKKNKRSSTPVEKRDIDKKRKGKKKKRDRDRSPNYKKYRK